MERHICTWFEEKNPTIKKTGELIIDGNNIEFYSHIYGKVTPTTFIENDGFLKHKVFTNGTGRVTNNKSLEYGNSYSVRYVLMQNFDFECGCYISDIVEISFSIPELIDWLRINTVFYENTTDNKMAAGECNLKPITIHLENPHIEIYFESKTLDESRCGDERTQIIIKNEPRIKVQYSHGNNIEEIMEDIECLMQFFGLLIGTVSVAQDIRLSFKNQSNESRLFFNRDMSYNTVNIGISNTCRTYYSDIANELSRYYLNWRKLHFDDSFSLLRRIYFSVNGKKDIYIEDIFVEYMRFLDGYYTRISNDEEKSKQISDALKSSQKSIKAALLNDDVKCIFKDAIQSVIPNWKCNSKHIGEIANYIAQGFLLKKPLKEKIREIDDKHFHIIKNNATYVQKLKKETLIVENISNEDIIKCYFEELANTRNYYSHNKLDKSGVLETSQIIKSINVLKATIISILLEYMGIDENLIRSILVLDSELTFETSYLEEENNFFIE